MIHSLLSLLVLSTPLAIEISEPLTLSTGEELKARYIAPSDEFCLNLEDFARLQGDQLHAKTYWQGRIEGLKADFIEQLDQMQAAHKQVHKAYLDEQKQLKDSLAEALKQRDLARDELWWWRGATVGLVLSTGATFVYLVTQ